MSYIPYQTVNPATGEFVQSFPIIGDADLEAAVSNAQACYWNDWRNRPVTDRAKIVGKAAEILRKKMLRNMPAFSPWRWASPRPRRWVR